MTRQRGFTLVETLVVITIIGLLAGAVVLTMPDNSASLRREAVALAARTKLAAQESIIAGAPTGLTVNSNGYTFFRQTAGAWAEITDEKAFARRRWDEEITAVVAGANRRPSAAPDAKTKIVPAIVFDPSGVVPQFTVALLREGARYTVASDEKGAIRVKADHDQP